ncbi:MAG: diphthamide biosynthesis enzyme Dph2 [Methanosarcinales archaeon]|jgi:2-(3-amino-3-carboxypropyl)histidine synthase|nr:diphthamide biosynthesis enzyme Dph2 [Methanosarcinales archaeon]
MSKLPTISPSSSSSSYDFEMKVVFDEIQKISKEKNCGEIVIGLQFPEGLKKHALDIASQIEREADASVYISADPCFGACDLDMRLLEKSDLFFHFGHAELKQENIGNKVRFIEARSKVDVSDAVKAAIPLLPEQTIGLVTTVQHVHQLENARRILEAAGKTVIIGDGDKRIAYPGQILGCNFSAALFGSEKDGALFESEKCGALLYIGSGQFHPIGAALSSKKRVVCADPFTSEVFELNDRKFLMQRSAVIGNAADAEIFCILVSTKNGQYRRVLAESIKSKAESCGKQAFILYMDLVTPDQMLSFKADAFVNTACPRLAIDDSGRYPAPVLTPQEFEIVLGERKWEDLVLDEILEGGQDE